jgi:hypothetical protein
MNTDSQDNSLRQLFHELRDTDERATPPFARVLHRAEIGRAAAHPWTWAFRLAAGCALLTLAGVGLWMHRSKPEPAQPVMASIMDWQSPTDFLLSTPTLADDSAATSQSNQ